MSNWKSPFLYNLLSSLPCISVIGLYQYCGPSHVHYKFGRVLRHLLEFISAHQIFLKFDNVKPDKHTKYFQQHHVKIYVGYQTRYHGILTANFSCVTLFCVLAIFWLWNYQSTGAHFSCMLDKCYLEPHGGISEN